MTSSTLVAAGGVLAAVAFGTVKESTDFLSVKASGRPHDTLDTTADIVADALGATTAMGWRLAAARAGRHPCVRAPPRCPRSNRRPDLGVPAKLVGAGRRAWRSRRLVAEGGSALTIARRREVPSFRLWGVSGGARSVVHCSPSTTAKETAP